MSKLVPTIGIEVHVELKTISKVFSDSLNAYGEAPNSKTNVIDLGYPGTLPILNKEVVNLAIKTCLATNSKIAPKMYFDRKNYFYPDLPKGYQITQATTPIGTDGYLEIEVAGFKKQINLERLHIEEDTSKSIHEGGSTFLDFNRAGVPLIEIVTKPVIKSAEEAVLYLEKLREILLYAGISDVKIEEGSMRCDANVSLNEEGSSVLGTKTEIKNIGSISSVRAAITFEIERQRQMLENGEKIHEETRRYDEKKSQTILMRSKESNSDYRYLPEPDIPYIYINEEWIANVAKKMPKLPDELRKEYVALLINDIAIKALIGRQDLAAFLENVIALNANPVIAANLLTGDVLSHLNKNNLKIYQTSLDYEAFAKLVSMLETEEISSKIGKEVLTEMLLNGGLVDDILNTKGLKQINDEASLLLIIHNVLDNNQTMIQEFKDGNSRSLKFLMGQIMKESKGQANPKVLQELLEREINR